MEDRLLLRSNEQFLGRFGKVGGIRIAIVTQLVNIGPSGTQRLHDFQVAGVGGIVDEGKSVVTGVGIDFGIYVVRPRLEKCGCDHRSIGLNGDGKRGRR